ncbi:DinB family protein, partial [Exiguobacterium sp. IPBC4]
MIEDRRYKKLLRLLPEKENRRRDMEP